jgi:hypothetical protein
LTLIFKDAGLAHTAVVRLPVVALSLLSFSLSLSPFLSLSAAGDAAGSEYLGDLEEQQSARGNEVLREFGGEMSEREAQRGETV